MKKSSLVLSIIASQFFFVGNADANEKIQASFNRIIKSSRISANEVGILVLDKNNTVVDVNAAKLMVPASLTKIVTAGAVLKKMPLTQKFPTQLKSAAKLENGALKGDLCLQGSGDPSFVSEKMWALVNDFTRSAITNIEGNLVVDASYFDTELYDSGRDSVRVDRAYDAPISATSFNWNSVNIYVRPGNAENEKAQIFLDPYSDYLELENKTTTTKKTNVKNINVSRVKNGRKDKILVTGEISLGNPEIVFYKSITNPTLWTGSHLKEFLKQRSINLKGSVVEGVCDVASVTYATVDSKNLINIVSDMLKYSNNYVAEMLAKNAATLRPNFQKINKNASMKEGIELIKTYLDEIGMKRGSYVYTNVSGLNRENQFSAKQLSSILTHIQNDFLIYPEFLAGLPIAGLDGTLTDRMKNDERFNLIRAKTGYLDGVVGLAGYVGRLNKEPLVFVFMFNGNINKGLDARVLFDNLSKELLKI